MADGIWLRFISGPDIDKLGLTRLEIVDAVEDAVREHGEGRTAFEPRVHLTPDNGGIGHFNVLRGHLDRLGERGISGVKVVGVDYLSVEEYKKPGAPAHHVLLGGGTIVIEGLNLRDVEPGVYEMYCLPLRIVGGDGAPARVVLRQS